MSICDLSPHRVHHRLLTRSGDWEELCAIESEGGDMLDEANIYWHSHERDLVRSGGHTWILGQEVDGGAASPQWICEERHI